MKVPKARKLSSGTWFIHLRLGGKNIPITGKDEKTCIRNAQAVKAEWVAQKRLPDKPKKPDASPTLSEAIDSYIDKKSRVLSPSTIRGYRTIQRTRFKTTMSRRINEIKDSEWQGIINAECANASPKTVNNAFMFISSVLRHECDRELPMGKIRLPSVPVSNAAFLQPEEIPKFVQAVKDTNIAVPALLALSSLRLSEIAALRWENIPKNPKIIRVQGAAVKDEKNNLVVKKQNKNASSTRSVPIAIPELAAAIERDRKAEGPVLNISPNWLRLQIHQICKDTGITDVNIHQLRHSWASLAYFLRVPTKIAMEIGGWSDEKTMQKIYTHVAQSDVKRYETELASFFKNAK